VVDAADEGGAGEDGVNLEERYLDAVYERAWVRPEADVNPSVLCQACLDVLPVDGAGISLTRGPLRVPLGWSSDTVGLAERAQTTVGAGPCLTVSEGGGALAADATTTAERWPVYWDELHRLTPFRSVASIPLTANEEPPFGALDLYAASADLSSALTLTEVSDAVARPVAAMLWGRYDQLYVEELDVRRWLSGQPAAQRIAVWTAAGMVIAGSGLNDVDALATMRGWAYSHGCSLDEIANSLIDGTTPVEALVSDV